jgi:putative oxygen-independent coproporphyrinogen III oxidase
MFQFHSLPPLSLYIHFPWCVQKCPYCDFNSHPLRADLPEERYVNALLADLEQDLPRVWGRRVVSIFLGGGTPSLFSPEAIDRLLSGVRARLPLVVDAEITLEANPGTVELGRFRGYREAGVNRLSIGIQSFDPEKLRVLGRIHGRNEALAAAHAARAAGFDNFNLDLMFGLPEQTPEQALADVRTAISFEPAHLSLYQLTLEPQTPFHARPPANLPDDDVLAAMQDMLQDATAAAGFAQYEVSAYARATRECRHNLNYWQFGDYLGIGAGAHAKITDALGITRLWKRKQPQDYLAHAGTSAAIGEERRLTPDDTIFEFMLNALRLTKGIPATLFEERAGLDFSLLEKPLEQADRIGFLNSGPGHIHSSPLGRRFLNDFIALFLPEPQDPRGARTD